MKAGLSARFLCWGELASRDTNEELEESQEIQCYKAEAAIEPQINTYAC